MKPLIVTAGEPAGIGTQLCLRLLADEDLPPLVVIGDGEFLRAQAARLGIPWRAADYARQPQARRALWHVPLAATVTMGELQPRNADYVLTQLRQAAQGCMRGEFSALVTAPLSKQAILAAGVAFVGQTEYLAECAGRSCPVMVLANADMRVALATTHLPLKAVPQALSRERLLAVLTVLNAELPRVFAAARPPLIKVCGLNPHAGEGGYLGDEEQTVIAPALAAARQMGMRVEGPLSADTLLATARIAEMDCVLAMYHDQGLPAIKRHNFTQTINVTLGLPFVRTSPDHGVALDRAAGSDADASSMIAALRFAAQAAAR